MDKNAAKKWRPIIRAHMENQTLDEALESILLILEAPGQRVVMIPSPASEKPDARPPRAHTQLRAVTGGRGNADTGSAPAPSEEKEPLSAEDYFTVEEGAAYLGIGRDRLYQILRSDPEVLPHRRESGARGREEYRLLGRGLNVFRRERQKTKSVANGAAPSD